MKYLVLLPGLLVTGVAYCAAFGLMGLSPAQVIPLYAIAGLLSGIGAAIISGRKLLHLYFLYCYLAVLVPLGGTLLVTVLALLSLKRGGKTVEDDPFQVGIPLQEQLEANERRDLIDRPLVSMIGELEAPRLQGILRELTRFDDVSIAPIYRRLRNHPSTPLQVTARNCFHQRSDRIEDACSSLRARLEEEPDNLLVLRDLAEVYVSLSHDRMIPYEQRESAASEGLPLVEKLKALAPDQQGWATLAETRFHLCLGQTDLAQSKFDECRRHLKWDDSVHQLAAELAFAQKDLLNLRNNLQQLENPSPDQVALHNFWLNHKGGAHAA